MMRIVVALIALGVCAGDALARNQPVCVNDVTHAATREQVEYESGTRTIRGLIYRPRRPNGAGVVLLHGARGLAADAPVFDPPAIQLASRGYHVLIPNYYDARPGRQQRSGQDMRTWRRAASDGVGFLGGQAGADPERVALIGYSLGGFLAVETAMEGGPAATAVGISAGVDVGEPGRARRDVALLLLHARRDSVISPASTRSWARTLRTRGAAVDVQTLDWEGHGFDRPTWCDAFARIQTFLDHTIGRDDRPPVPQAG